jgi:hypothetical protein
VAIVTIEKFFFIVNSTDMGCKASLPNKSFAANLTLKWLQYYMSHFAAVLEIFSSTNIYGNKTVFFVVKTNLGSQSSSKTQLNKSVGV